MQVKKSQPDCRAQFCPQCRAWTQKKNLQKKEDGNSYSYFCAESHPFGNHTRDYLLGSRAESRKRDAGAVTGQTPSSHRSCKMEVRDSPQMGGTCDQVGHLGDRLPCLNRGLEFIKTEPDGSLKQVMTHSDCTICLSRGHNTDAHIAEKPENWQTCGVYD